MSNAASHLKSLLQMQAMQIYERWDLVDTHGWLIPKDVDAEAFLAERDKEAEQEAATEKILRTLEDTLDAVPAPVIEQTQELYNSIERENYDDIAFGIIETIGVGFDPVDATEFVQALNGLLSSRRY